MLTIPTYYYGDIPIEVWEYPAFVLLLIGIWLVAGFIRRSRIRSAPEYRYFLWGLWAKVAGGLGFGIIYIFYYKGGDTIGYFSSAYAYCELFWYNFGDFLHAYFGPVKQETLSVFSQKTGEPLGYMFFNRQTRTVFKLIVPLMLFTGKSYFITGLLMSVITYSGVWSLYRMTVRYFPGINGKLAIAILFMPSVVFWGSGISKDSLTLAGTCFFLSSTGSLIDRRPGVLQHVILLAISAGLIVLIKPYILLILLPGTILWITFRRISLIRNALIRYSVVPFSYLIIIGGSYGALSLLGGSLGKFSIDKALETAAITQRDLKQDYYQGNSFDIGEFEPTPLGVAGKAVPAIIAGLYRPFIWESRNVVMWISALENTLVLSLTLLIIFRLNPFRAYQVVSGHPFLLCGFIFSLLFAFMIGLTTSNFGALVRFRIPLVPLYMTVLMVLFQTLRQRSGGLTRPNIRHR